MHPQHKVTGVVYALVPLEIRTLSPESHRQYFRALWYTHKECLDKLEVAQPKLQVQMLEEIRDVFHVVSVFLLT